MILSIIASFITTAVWPGLGLLGESYLLFSLGILQPLLPQTLPTNTPSLLITGVIIGMLVLGIAANSLGRRFGSCLTASLMLLGAAGLLSFCSSAADVDNTIFLTSSLLLLGFGVGGEYPLAASSASEKAMEDTPQKSGRRIQLVFSMQGMGILLHCVLFWILLEWETETTQEDEELHRWYLLRVWKVLYGVGVFLLLLVLVTRMLHLEESKAWLDDRRQRLMVEQKQQQSEQLELPERPMSIASPFSAQHTTTENGKEEENSHESGIAFQQSRTVSSLSVPSVALMRDNSTAYMLQRDEPPESTILKQRQYHRWRLAYELYGSRLLGVSLSWFLWDISFYGNKLFQSTFLLALTGQEEGSDTASALRPLAAAATLNATVAALGYLTAAAIIDRVGRRALQLTGFTVTGILYVMTGFALEAMPNQRPVTIALYCLSSFMGQVGPNATTFVIPSQVFPTALRTTGHGVAAATGKLGALVAAILFGRTDSTLDMFLYSGYASLLGAVVTYWWIPLDTTTTTTTTTDTAAQEEDTIWRNALAGRPFTSNNSWSVAEQRYRVRKQQEAVGNYVTSDVHDAVEA